jgi:D-galactarolactone cycloisomerase
MKITHIDGYPLDFPQQPPWAYAKGWVTSAPALLIEVHTDEGISGWGEGYGPPAPTLAMIRSLCGPVVIGADPFRTEDLWSRLYHDARDFAAASGAMAAISAIDIACWDIKGKALGVPVCTLLGGAVRTELPCYASAVRYQRQPDDTSGLALADPSDLALTFVDQGFKAIKMTVGLLEPAEDLRRVRRVRDALPADVELMIDANHAYTARQATTIGLALQELNVTWFEDPLPPDDLPGYEALRSRLTIALAGGETLTTRAGYREVLTRHLLDIILPETGLAGGLTECKKIIDLAYIFGVECTPHGYASVVGTAAALHLAAAMPHQPSPTRPALLPFEYAPEPFSRLGDLLNQPFEFQQGVLQVPLDRPGLGAEIDREALKRRRLA